jgi:hypothetical protein
MSEVSIGHQGNNFEAQKPSFHDLQKSAETSVVGKAVARYLIPRNPDKSILRHERLGTPVVRKVVMGTVGRLGRSGSGGNYRLDNSRSRIEAATNFAFRGSVFNEAVHTIFAAPATVSVAMNIAENHYSPSTAINVAGAGVNLALVALQRYNRARMVKFVDGELKRGKEYKPAYKNWLGIDARAMDNYQTKSKG